MRILLISHEMTYTGAPNSLLNIARLLRSKGWHVTVRTLAGGNFSLQYAKHGFHVRWLNENLSVEECKKLASQFDLIVCNTIFCAKLACKLQQCVKTILYIREAENLPELLEKFHIDEGFLRNAENVICVSEYAERFIVKKYNPKRLWVLHNFLITPPFHRPGGNKVRGGKVRFLIAATVEKRKGIDIAVKAIKLLPKHISDRLVLDIAGRKPDWSKEYWENLIPENDPRFNYHGEVRSGKTRLFKRANVIVVPSFDESCSLTALEGAMFGKPLIVTENVGAKYLAKGCGFTVKTGNAEELAQAVKFFVENKKELDTAGKNCYGKFRETSTAKVYYKNIYEIFMEVLGE